MLRRAIGIVGTIVMLAAAAVVVPQRGKADSSKDVLVVNAPSQPVPVSLTGGTGTANVNVANQPTVNLAGGTTVGINGTPSVSVANQPTVSLAPGAVVGILGTPTVQLASNTALQVGEADNTVQQPFQSVSNLVEWTDGQGTANGLIPFPAGKRLIIEYVSATANVPPGQKVALDLLTPANGTSEFHTVLMTFQGSWAGHDSFSAGQMVRLYADSDPSAIGVIGVHAERNDTSSSGDIGVTISGHLVNLP